MELEILNTKLKTELTVDLFHKLVSQLQKDFVLTGIQYDFSDLDPNQLINSLNEIMEELLNKEYPTLLNLLYRMDIPESAIKFHEEETVELQLVEVILRREFLKVQMRAKYSG